MRKATFAVEVPPDTWMADVSRRFPGVTFRLLTGVPVGDRAVELGEVIGDGVGPAVEAFRSHPSIHEYERLYHGDERSLARYETGDRGMYDLLEAAAAPPEFPITLRDGWAEFEVTGTHEGVQAARAALDAADGGFEVRAVVGDADPDALLTDRQRELLTTGIRRGYYDVPRECTLTELADHVGVDPSTASGVVRRGEARLVTWFLTGSGAGANSNE
jgi:predicted DNA binding protein